jgi:hypothetical protein
MRGRIIHGPESWWRLDAQPAVVAGDVLDAQRHLLAAPVGTRHADRQECAVPRGTQTVAGYGAS